MFTCLLRCVSKGKLYSFGSSDLHCCCTLHHLGNHLVGRSMSLAKITYTYGLHSIVYLELGIFLTSLGHLNAKWSACFHTKIRCPNGRLHLSERSSSSYVGKTLISFFVRFVHISQNHIVQTASVTLTTSVWILEEPQSIWCYDCFESIIAQKKPYMENLWNGCSSWRAPVVHY